ncbi:hypothetical protein GFM18_04430 [Rhizobium laguerreae]|nr:hypothetical protein [Rhizobium laguerreae]
MAGLSSIAMLLLLQNSLNRNRFKDKMMQQFKVLQRPLRVSKDARRCRQRLPPVGGRPLPAGRLPLPDAVLASLP